VLLALRSAKNLCTARDLTLSPGSLPHPESRRRGSFVNSGPSEGRN
jgi:hypothetical protein